MKKKRKLVSKYEQWETDSKVKAQSSKLEVNEIIEILLMNRGIITEKQKKEYFNPTLPYTCSLQDFGVDSKSIKVAIRRIKKAQKDGEKVIIFGDYDVDGITSSAILWKYLYSTGLDVTPYIPERFSEGYGIKSESIINLKKKYPKLSLIITVDNGIVAFDAIKCAGDLGIDTIVADHHEKGKKYPIAYSVIHTTKLSGAGISWVLVRELDKVIRNTEMKITDMLELVVLGTVADQMPLNGINRSFVKYGLEMLNTTKNAGLNALFDIARISKGSVGVYEINYMIAPRLNAMGRLEHAIDSLRLLCTKNRPKAQELADHLNRTNLRRQKIVDEVLLKARKVLAGKKPERFIVLDDGSYHEGVIGLAASKIADEFWRPAIVISKGPEISKGSARSIPGFNIIRAIRSQSEIILGGGGHEMAAGFSIKTGNIPAFRKGLNEYGLKWLNDSILEKKTKVDMALGFDSLSGSLIGKIKEMEPFGIGNPSPVFLTKDCEVVDIRKVGTSGNHLKFKIRNNGVTLDAISFNNSNSISDISPGMKIDVLYNLEENYWNGLVSLQLKVKDLK